MGYRSFDELEVYKAAREFKKRIYSPSWNEALNELKAISSVNQAN